MNITDTYHIHATQSPKRIAIRTNNEIMTYEQWNQIVSLTSSWLQKQQAKRKRIGILMPNSLSFLQIFAGAAHAGWTAVPFDVKWSLSEIQDRIDVCKPDIIISNHRLDGLTKKNHPILHISDFQRSLHEMETKPFFPVPSQEEPFYMGFTSGSTGKPKAFIRSHRSWVKSFDCNIVDFHMKKDDHVLIPGALIHSHFLYGAISTLFLGGTVHLLENFNPVMTLNILKNDPISIMYSVPTMVEALLKEEEMITRTIKIFSSGAKWGKESKSKLQTFFPSAMLYEFYGASELSFVSVLSQKDFIRKPTSVGKPCHNVEIMVVKNEKEEIAVPNEIGKIFVKSDMIFIGYLTNPDEAPPQRKEEWMSVGDMGYLDEDGFLYIIGRENSMILYGGINIFPEEIESVLSANPAVEEVAVIGTPDSYWGEIVTAVIKGNCEKRELRKYCRGKLANYKIPRNWIFVDGLPHTSGGKIARAEVRRWMAEGMLTQ